MTTGRRIMTRAAIAAVAVVAVLAAAKDKTKPTMPAYVLRARTVAILIDPQAGVSLDDPKADAEDGAKANEIAQKDVETALLNWGRFQPVLSAQNADLIIVVRRGHGKMVDRTMTNPRQNNHPGSVTPFDGGVSIGAQHGRQPNPVDGQSAGGTSGMGDDSPHAQTEIGAANDFFAVYEGGVESPLDAPPAWRYVAKDGLRPHTVPAVAEFRKALDEADKAAAEKAAKKP